MGRAWEFWVKVAEIKWGDKHLRRLLFETTTLACSGEQRVGGRYLSGSRVQENGDFLAANSLSSR